MTYDLHDLKQDYDWQEAFNFAAEAINVVHGNTCSNDGFVIDDVVRVIALDDGENDSEDWVGVFELRDGRFVFITAGCCYPGWDCQGGGNAFVASTLCSLVHFGLGEEDRLRLNFAFKLA